MRTKQTGSMNIPAELADLHKKADAVFTAVHCENEAAGQQDPNLRQLVSLMSATLSDLDKAKVSAARAYEPAP